MLPKCTIILDLQIPKSGLFYSNMVHGKKESLNESILQWYVGISSELGVLCEWDSWGINWKRYAGSPQDLNL